MLGLFPSHDRSGDKVIDNDNVSDVDAALKFFGITPSSVSRKRDEVWATSRANTAVNDLRSRYYKRIAKATVERNRLYSEGKKEEAAEMQAVLDAIMQEINRHNQTSPIHERIIPNRNTIKQKIREEMMGSDAKRIRKQARPRAEELKEIYGR